MRKISKKQMPLMPSKIDHPQAKELNNISCILDKNPTIYELALQDLSPNSQKSKKGAKGMTAEQVVRAAIVDNWPVVEHFMMARLWEEMVSTQNKELLALYHEISGLRIRTDVPAYNIDHELPMLSLTLKKDSIKASFFTTITTLGTPLDLTTQELRIESLFPADDTTRQLFAGENIT